MFTDPQTVLSPKANVSDVVVLLNTGENGWSLASLRWDSEPVLGMRWNGHSGNPIGNPQSRGLPTWFVLPEELRETVLARLRPSAASSFENFPDDIKRVRLRPLPKRYLGDEDQGPKDFVWTVEKVDKEKGTLWISNPATGHRFPLYAAHIESVTPDSLSDQPGIKHGFLNLTVQIIFRNTSVSLELLPHVKAELARV